VKGDLFLLAGEVSHPQRNKKVERKGVFALAEVHVVNQKVMRRIS